jgi:hypothetical protein
VVAVPPGARIIVLEASVPVPNVIDLPGVVEEVKTCAE